MRLLLRGASPAAACAQLGIAPQEFLTWLDDPEFRRRIAQSQDILSQNVAAALYRSAMEGSVSAQTFYLRHLPPPEWSLVASAQKAGEPLNQLSDDELIDFCRARGIDLPISPVEGGDPAADAADSP